MQKNIYWWSHFVTVKPCKYNYWNNWLLKIQRIHTFSFVYMLSFACKAHISNFQEFQEFHNLMTRIQKFYWLYTRSVSLLYYISSNLPDFAPFEIIKRNVLSVIFFQWSGGNLPAAFSYSRKWKNLIRNPIARTLNKFYIAI